MKKKRIYDKIVRVEKREKGEISVDRKMTECYIYEQYGVKAEFPWKKYPEYMVIRHSNNRKWFAVIMNISKRKLGIESDEIADIINIKCNSLMIGSLIMEDGIFPAYHMNKSNWVSVLLDNSCNMENLKLMIDSSYILTK